MTRAERAELRRNTWESAPGPVQEHSISNVPPVSEENVADETTQEVKQERKVQLFPKKGSTRGKNPREIEYMAFDLAKPDSLPVSPDEFNEVTGTKDVKVFMEYLIGGYNDAMYSAASDEIGEFINDEWDKDTQTQFRLAVRSFSKVAMVSIEEAVNLIKPGVEKGWILKQQKQAEEAKAALAAQSQPATV